MKDCDCLSIYVRTKLDYNNDGEGAEELTELCNYSFENISLYADPSDSFAEEANIRKYPVFIEGFEDEEGYVKNVSFKNIKVIKSGDDAADGFFIKNTKNISFE